MSQLQLRGFLIYVDGLRVYSERQLSVVVGFLVWVIILNAGNNTLLNFQVFTITWFPTPRRMIPTAWWRTGKGLEFVRTNIWSHWRRNHLIIRIKVVHTLHGHLLAAHRRSRLLRIISLIPRLDDLLAGHIRFIRQNRPLNSTSQVLIGPKKAH